MFPSRPLPYARLTAGQQDAWGRFLERLDGFMGVQDMEDDPLLIHGTSLLRAEWIRRDGFNGYGAPSRSGVQDMEADPLLIHGTSLLRAEWIRRDGFNGYGAPSGSGLAGQVFWTSHVQTAQDFAEGRVGMARDRSVDDLPIVLAARLSDILSAGEAQPDNNYRNGDEEDRKTWQEGLREDGLLRLMGSRDGSPIKVSGLRLLGPDWRSIPLHPGASDNRTARLADKSRLQPPPGLEWSGMGPALPWEAMEPMEFGKREPCGRIVLDEEAWYDSLMPKSIEPGVCS